MISRALIVLVVVMVAFSARADGIFICDELTDGECTHFSAVLDGVATFENAGVTTDAIAESVGWGIGVILVFFMLGLGLGTAHRSLAIALGSSRSDTF